MQTPYFLLFILIFYNWFAIIYIDIDSGAKVEWEKWKSAYWTLIASEKLLTFRAHPLLK